LIILRARKSDIALNVLTLGIFTVFSRHSAPKVDILNFELFFDKNNAKFYIASPENLNLVIFQTLIG